MSELLVGYARVDITPKESVPLGGMGNGHARMPSYVNDPLYTTCIAFTDAEGSTALMYTSDLLSCQPEVTQQLQEAAKEEFGIPRENVVISCTHTHSAPEQVNKNFTSITRYNDMYVMSMIAAARMALDDRKPAQMSIGHTTHTQGLNYVRHYTKDENGNWSGHKAETDPMLQVLKIQREDAPDILLMNWQAHPCRGMRISMKCVSADYIGSIRNYIEKKTDYLFAFFQGAAGNLGSSSKIPQEKLTNDMDTYGALLGERALAALADMQPVASGKVRGICRDVTMEVDHSDDARVEDARIVAEFWKKTNDRKATDQMAKPYGFNSPYHATATIRRANMPATKEMEIGGIAVGDFAFTWSPYEMFCDNGAFVRENSPFPATFVLSCANGSNSYIVSKAAFDYGCYERDNRNFVRGTAEMLADSFVGILKEMR